VSTCGESWAEDAEDAEIPGVLEVAEVSGIVRLSEWR
jgi:hypothetical protein